MPWQPEFLIESNSVNNFWKGPPKEHSCQVWSKLAQLFGRRCLKKLLTTHNRHLTTLKAPLEHVVLRWAKNQEGRDLSHCPGFVWKNYGMYGINDLGKGYIITHPIMKELTLILICQFWALPTQQQIKIWCHKYWQMGIQISDWVENIVGKEEIARYVQFLLFPQCFQKLMH